MPGGSLNHGLVRFTTREETADVAVILNYLKYDTRITAREGYIWCWHNEPIVRKPFSRGFDRIFTHERSSDSRASTAPPVLDWWLKKSWDELSKCKVPAKKARISAIASTKQLIAGHAQRHAFLEQVHNTFPSLPIFGEGRANRLDDKWDGLAPYQYSLAIENSSTPDYWSEKIADCFLSFTVPLYFGAPNIGKYFPENSYIWLPIDQPEKALGVIEDVLESDKFESRLTAVVEARRRVLEDYSFFGQVHSRVEREAEKIMSRPILSTKVHGRRTRKGGWVRDTGLLENLRVQARRLRARSTPLR